jgi:hypothetical protein
MTIKPAPQEPIRLSRPSDVDPVNLPERVADLERRVTELERLTVPRPDPRPELQQAKRSNPKLTGA